MSKRISLEEVRHIAWLSRLGIDGTEEELFVKQLDAILAYMEILGKCDVSDVEPLFSPYSQKEHQRPDIAENLRTRDEILKNAPLSDGQYFIVPRIV